MIRAADGWCWEIMIFNDGRLRFLLWRGTIVSQSSGSATRAYCPAHLPEYHQSIPPSPSRQILRVHIIDELRLAIRGKPEPGHIWNTPQYSKKKFTKNFRVDAAALLCDEWRVGRHGRTRNFAIYRYHGRYFTQSNIARHRYLLPRDCRDTVIRWWLCFAANIILARYDEM